jgi:tagatose-1,6-bisphosphate aldolase
MTTLSVGKWHGLQQCASARGAFTALALDHRQNLRQALNPQAPQSVSDADLTAFKLDVTRALASAATAVLLDPEFSAAQAIASGALPGDKGLVVAAEATGYTGDPAARQSQILPGWSVAKAKRLGASMVKLLVYYHPDSPTALEIESFVKQVSDECAASDLALMLEPLSYSLNSGEGKLSASERRRVVIETARRLTPLGVDLLKAEFPADPGADENEWVSACAELSAASAAPWIVLSAAVDFETYLRQVRVACEAGASGIAVGRAVWKEAVALAGEARARFLRDTALPRLVRLTSLCNALAKPWTNFYEAPSVKAEWYANY